MDRSTQWAVVLTAVGIVALALSAATLPSTVSSDTAGPGSSNESGSGFLSDGDEIDPIDIDIGIPEWIMLGLVVAAVAFVVVYSLVEPRKALMQAVVVTVVVAALFVGLILISELLASLRGGGGGGDNLLGGGGGLSTGGEVVSSTVDPSLLAVGGLVAVVVVVAAVALYGATGDAEEAEPGQPAADGGDGASIEDVGRAAGRAADRIEARAGVDNEVYRAWREMATLLAADRPETSTPGEFADDATGAGMDPADVEELTRLFEEVRYGDAPATEERERRAVAILRRIEATYADEEDRWT